MRGDYKKDENLISFDVQGWGIYQMNVREILQGLGCELIDGKWVIDDNDPRLDNYPRRLKDDGMGYGVDEERIVEVSNEEGFCNIFTEERLPNIELWKRGKFFDGADVHEKGENRLNLTVREVKEQDGELIYSCYYREKGYKTMPTYKWVKEKDLEWGWI